MNHYTNDPQLNEYLNQYIQNEYDGGAIAIGIVLLFLIGWLILILTGKFES